MAKAEDREQEGSGLGFLATLNEDLLTATLDGIESAQGKLRPNTLLPFGEDESLLTDGEREDTEAGQRAVLNGMTLAEYLDDQGEEAWERFGRASERTAG